MNITTIGLLLLVLFLFYFLYLSIKLILIGRGIIKHPIKGDYVEDKGILIRGIIGAVVTVPFLCFIIFILLA